MALFLSLLPLYLLGNLHCVGMCGPLVIMLGKHRYRYYYFLGRITSFALAGFAAAALGQVLAVLLQRYQVAAVASLACGVAFIAFGIAKLCTWHPAWMMPPAVLTLLRHANRQMSMLMLRDRAWPTFLFGLLTVTLPCGQSLFVFSACALSADVSVGLFNGFAFAVLTTPSLYLAMRAHTALAAWRNHYDTLLAGCAILAGVLALCRGFAEMGILPHYVLNPDAHYAYHIALF